jgi:hypothetical protein
MLISSSANRSAAKGLVLALALLLAPGESHAAKESFAYAPPERQPRGQRSRFVPEAPDAVFQRVWSVLEEQGLRIESVNPQARVVVARYGGDPRPYIDCGIVTQLVDGEPADPPRQYSANKAEVRTGKWPKGRRYGLLRRLQLDARLMVRVEPRGKGARLFSDAIYVATMSINRLRKGGKVDELVAREVVSFTSAESGRFAKGTVCVGTGRLERLPLDPFKTEG